MQPDQRSIQRRSKSGMTPKAKPTVKKHTKKESQNGAKPVGKASAKGNSKSSTNTRSRAASQMTDHEEIRNWAEAHGGVHAGVRGTRNKRDNGMIPNEVS